MSLFSLTKADSLILFCFLSLCLVVKPRVSIAQCTTGLVIDEEAYQNRSLAVAEYARALPGAFSLKQYCPKPSTQLSFSTSAGWAASYYGLTILESQKQKWSNTDEITQRAFAPVFPYRNLSIEGCEIESSIFDILYALKVTGAPTFRDYPYFCPENEWKSEGKELTKLHDFAKVFDKQEEKVNAIKKSLASGNPVIVGLKVPPTFCDAQTIWRPYEGVSEEFGGHALCVVGYDDNSYGGSIEVVNSWGRSWGNEGFSQIRYSDVERWAEVGYQLLNVQVSEKPQVTIDGKLSHGSPMEVELIEANQYLFKRSFGSGTEFSFEINTNFSGYLYITHRGNSGEYSTLFPGMGQSPMMPYTANRINFPTEGRIRLDNDKGEEKICFIVSKDELTNTEIFQLSRQITPISPSSKFQHGRMAIDFDDLDEPIMIEVLLDHI